MKNYNRSTTETWFEYGVRGTRGGRGSSYGRASSEAEAWQKVGELREQRDKQVYIRNAHGPWYVEKITTTVIIENSTMAAIIW